MPQRQGLVGTLRLDVNQEKTLHHHLQESI